MDKGLLCILGLHAEKVARYESYLQTHAEYKYTEEKRIILEFSEELCRKGTVQSYEGVLGPVARGNILAMSTIATGYRVL